MYFGTEKDYAALCTMYVCAVVLCFQSYELYQHFYLVVVQTMPDFIASLLFCGVVKNRIQYFFLKDLAGGGEVAYLQIGNTEKKSNKFNTSSCWPIYKGTP